MGDTPEKPNGTPSNEKEISMASGDGSQDHEVLSRHRPSWWKKTYAILSWTPPRCRYDPDKPFQFSMALNILFGQNPSLSNLSMS